MPRNKLELEREKLKNDLQKEKHKQLEENTMVFH